MPILVKWAILCSFPLLAGAQGAEEGRGLQRERRVKAPGRLDWEFVAGKGARLPGGYDSRRQRYLLFVPPSYSDRQRWPLVVFLSPGDDPLGWSAWRKWCEENGWLFAAPYGAGNACDPTQRVRLVLDVLDDVRRHYRIDGERTYLAGMGGGATLACRIAFALPDQVAGVFALGGAIPVPDLDYLRQRAKERLSLALLATEEHPSALGLAMARGLGMRCQLWKMPVAEERLPAPDLLARVHAWLEADLPRRREDRRERVLAVDEAPARAMLARKAVDRAEAWLHRGRLHEGAALLEWVLARGGRTEGGEHAHRLLTGLRADPRRQELLRQQRDAAHYPFLAAQAQALAEAGQIQEARRAWLEASRLNVSPEQQNKARTEVKRLDALRARIPYLGLTLAGDTTTVRSIHRGGPAARAGLRAGDRVIQVESETVHSPADLRRQLGRHKPGDALVLTIQRERREVQVVLVLGVLPET